MRLLSDFVNLDFCFLMTDDIFMPAVFICFFLEKLPVNSENSWRNYLLILKILIKNTPNDPVIYRVD